MTNTNEEVKTSKTKKVFKTIGLGILAVLAGIAIYDHRKEICNGAKNTVSWAKKTIAKKTQKPA